MPLFMVCFCSYSKRILPTHQEKKFQKIVPIDGAGVKIFRIFANMVCFSSIFFSYDPTF